jgi:hypothetical protein
MRDHPFSGNQCTNSNEQDRNTPDGGDASMPPVAPSGSDAHPFEAGAASSGRDHEHRVQRDRRDDYDYDFEHLSADGPTYLRQLQAREESRRFSGVLARSHASRKHDPHGAEDPHDQEGHDEALAYRHRDGSFRRRRRPLARRRG